jgi:hypothetical protein
MVGNAYLQVAPSPEPRTLRFSKGNKKYRKPRNLSSQRQKVGPSVKWKLLNGWLRTCVERHSDQCQRATETKGLKMPARVIDVYSYCVVETPTNCEYLTLSYVWGQKDIAAEMPTLTVSNIEALQKLQALSRIVLPATIDDALYTCIKLGRQYLWVDSLCIVQDDEHDVKEQLGRMGDIYSGSFLTLIAAWGDHADCGLPGVVWGPPRTPQQKATFEGLEIAEVLPSLDDTISYSTWKTRAWTYVPPIPDNPLC